MAYTKTNWIDRQVQKPLTFTSVTNGDGTITLTPAEGNVITAGTPLQASTLNNMETGIYNNDTAIATLNTQLANISTKFQTAGGNATALTLTINSLTDGVSVTFVASYTNTSGSATINGYPLYKPATTTAPNITVGKAYTVWYNQSNACFFIKASAEGTTIASHVLAGDTFSNDADTGLVGTATLLYDADRQSLITLNNNADSNNTAIKQNVVTALATRGVSALATDMWSSLVTKMNVDIDVIASNIKSGIVIDGVTGTYVGKRVATGSSAVVGASPYTVTITGIPFRPSKIILFTNSIYNWGIFSNTNDVCGGNYGNYCYASTPYSSAVVGNPITSDGMVINTNSYWQGQTFSYIAYE